MSVQFLPSSKIALVYGGVSTEHQISINTKPGVYILNIVDESNKRKSEKLIIK